jgi:hypothetical protein
MLGAEWLTLYAQSLLSMHNVKIIEALAYIADTEDFKTYRDEYISSVKDARLLQDVKLKVVDKMLSDFPQKRLIRPLQDAIDRSRRKYHV